MIALHFRNTARISALIGADSGATCAAVIFTDASPVRQKKMLTFGAGRVSFGGRTV